MKRRIINIIAFLLLGAIINVAVAWGCARTWDADSIPITGSWDLSRKLANGNYENWSLVERRRPGCLIYVSEYKAESGVPRGTIAGSAPTGVAGWMYTDAPVRHDVIPNYIDARGWPLPALWSQYTRNYYSWHFFHGQQGVNVGLDMVDTPTVSPNGTVTRRVLPLHPLLLGFVANASFYAAILWLILIGPFALRRWRRIKRGLCPACAYPVGTSDVCTECGVVLRPKASL